MPFVFVAGLPGTGPEPPGRTPPSSDQREHGAEISAQILTAAERLASEEGWETEYGQQGVSQTIRVIAPADLEYGDAVDVFSRLVDTEVAEEFWVEEVGDE